MVHQNEIVMLTLGIGVYFLILSYRRYLKRIVRWPILLTAYHILLVAFVMTIVEGFLWAKLLNIIEHMCYALSAILTAVWCWYFTAARTEGKSDVCQPS